MIVPPPLLQLAADEMRLALPARPGGQAEIWRAFGAGVRQLVAGDRVAEIVARAALFRPATLADDEPLPRKRRRAVSPRARHRQKVKQHNRRLAQRQAEQQQGG